MQTLIIELILIREFFLHCRYEITIVIKPYTVCFNFQSSTNQIFPGLLSLCQTRKIPHVVQELHEAC